MESVRGFVSSWTPSIVQKHPIVSGTVGVIGTATVLDHIFMVGEGRKFVKTVSVMGWEQFKTLSTTQQATAVAVVLATVAGLYFAFGRGKSSSTEAPKVVVKAPVEPTSDAAKEEAAAIEKEKQAADQKAEEVSAEKKAIAKEEKELVADKLEIAKKEEEVAAEKQAIAKKEAEKEVVLEMCNQPEEVAQVVVAKDAEKAAEAAAKSNVDATVKAEAEKTEEKEQVLEMGKKHRKKDKDRKDKHATQPVVVEQKPVVVAELPSSSITPIVKDEPLVIALPAKEEPSVAKAPEEPKVKAPVVPAALAEVPEAPVASPAIVAELKEEEKAVATTEEAVAVKVEEPAVLAAPAEAVAV